MGALNEPKYSSQRIESSVADIIIHPEYKSPATYHDIALIRLKTKVRLSYGRRPFVRPACLSFVEVPESRNVTATGWGELEAYGGEESDLKLTVSKCIQ